jgi:GT2 family glycosyltransferase
MHKVSILTLNYNGLKVLKSCVESVLDKCSNVDFQWVIRENNSTDGSLDYLKTVNPDKQEIKIVVCNNDGNFSKMNNEVIDECDGEYLLFLNNDVTALTDFITPMVSILEKDKSIGSVGSVLRYPDGRMQHCGVVFNENGSAFNLGYPFANLHNIDVERVIKHDRIYQVSTGACLMVRKSEFIELGMFDENYNWCYDDVDLCMRLTHYLGKPSVVAKDSKLIHHESWSKAKPANYDALRRLKAKFKDTIKGDYWFYNLDSYNVYKI